MSIKGFSVNGVTQKYDYTALDNKPMIPSAVTVDTALSTTSTNPVQNKAITARINEISSSVNTMSSNISAVSDEIGDLSDLNTTAKGNLVEAINEAAQSGGSGGEGTTNYNYLSNKPSINGVELSGNKTAAQLGLVTPSDIPAASISNDLKQALLQLAQKVAYVDADGQDYYQDLYDALYPSAVLTSITAAYTQSGTVYTTDTLDSLKPDLTVTAQYDDGSSEDVTNYTLSGNLTAGTSVITASYQGKTATFNVTVTRVAGTFSISNNLTGCSSSNSATTVAENASYNATITANTGYTLTGATVSITMGGSSVTGYYSNGTISIPNVTGDVVITVVATAVTLSSISAVFNQGSAVIYDTDALDSLKQYLTVTATYSDNTTATVPSADYTLSGTLTEGTSTITVSYQGKTTTFNVTVTQTPVSYLYNWDFTQSLIDSVGGVEAVLSTANASRDSTGLHITGATGFANFGKILAPNRVYELDIGSMDTSAWTSGHGRLVIWYSGNGSGLVYRSSGTWAIYKGSWVEASPAIADKAYFANSTLKIKTTNATSNNTVYIYKDNVEVMQTVSNSDPTSANNDLYIGGAGSNAAFSVTITAMRVYEEA